MILAPLHRDLRSLVTGAIYTYEIHGYELGGSRSTLRDSRRLHPWDPHLRAVDLRIEIFASCTVTCVPWFLAPSTPTRSTATSFEDQDLRFVIRVVYTSGTRI